MAKRGQKPKPTQLRMLEGNPGKRPLPKREPVVQASLPGAPDHLSAEAREEWDRVAVELHNIGVLSEFDRAALAAYCQAYGRWVQAERKLTELGVSDPVWSGLLVTRLNGAATQSPLVSIANKAMHEMMRFAVELGMTPSSRTRVERVKKVGSSKWDGLLA